MRDTRYQVWWTGDSVSLYTTVNDMLEQAIGSFKPYVHSDCGGNGQVNAATHGGDVIRWTAFCAFGAIFRYHGDHHVPWLWGTAVEDTIRVYLNMRAKLLPSLVAGGYHVTETAFPLAARGDLYWPQCPLARSSPAQFVEPSPVGVCLFTF
jgi:alpha-glucosidase (family GH31 glycosyl hydrolase)